MLVILTVCCELINLPLPPRQPYLAPLLNAPSSVCPPQCIAMGLFPKLRIIHTDKEYANRIFIPFVNYTIMLLCVVVTVAYGVQDSPADNLANAYGEGGTDRGSGSG